METSLFFIYVTISVFLFSDLVNGQNYVMPVPGDCTKYQVCDYSGCFVFNCGIGTEFNPRVLVCDYPLRDRGACSFREANIGPLIPYPGRNVPSYPSNPNPGNLGNPGYPGAGNPGYPGAPGAPGFLGAPGNPGSPGYSGGPGSTGFPGAQGNQGFASAPSNTGSPGIGGCPVVTCPTAPNSLLG